MMPRRCSVLVTLLLIACAAVPMALAEDKAPGPSPVIIRGAAIMTQGDRGTIESGTIVLRKGKIAAVRKDARPGPGDAKATVIDASGMFVTPGLIDASTRLGMSMGGQSRSGRASLSALDALNAFDRHLFEECLRNGVTTVCIEAPAGRGFAGRSALIRLDNLDDLYASATEAVALTARVGLGRVGPIARLGEIKALRTKLEGAVAYREALEEYEEKLEEYVKELEAGKTVKLKKDEKGGKKGADAKKGKGPKRPRRSRRPRGGSEDRGGIGPTVAPPDRDPGVPRCPKHPWIEVVCCCPECSGVEHVHDHHDVPDPLPPWLTLSKDKKKRDKKPEKGDKDELTKPVAPALVADNEILVKALKRELPVRFEVHRPADILQVLALIEAFNLDASLVGASGAALVSKELTEAKIPVIVGQLIPAGPFDNSHKRDLHPSTPGRLAAAGVPLVVAGGSNASGATTHYLTQSAAIAVGHGLDADAAMRAITINAAKLCGADATLGSLEKGKLADVVIWSGRPLAPDSVVEYVFVGGVEVYRRGQ